MKKVYIALPAYSGNLRMEMAHCLMGEIAAFADHNCDVYVQPLCGFADLQYCKSLLLSLFLSTDCTDFCLVDYDLQWPRGELVKLTDYDVDFVGGVYPARRDPITYQVNYIDRPMLEPDKTGDLIEVATVPGGFWRLKRSVVERMVQAYPELEFSEPRVPNGKSHALFWNLLEDGMFYGEDLSFCKRWTAIGGKVWAKPDITFTHLGLKGFVGNFGDWLKGDRGEGDKSQQGTSELPEWARLKAV